MCFTSDFLLENWGKGDLEKLGIIFTMTQSEQKSDEDNKAGERGKATNVYKVYRWRRFQNSPWHQKDNVLYGNTVGS